MDVRIKKWGNSIGLRIPHRIARSMGLNENSVVEITTENDEVRIKKKKEAELTLDDLISSIPKGFQYLEVLTKRIGLRRIE